MYIQVRSSLYSRINYVPQPLAGNFSAECPGIDKTMHTGFSAYVLHYANAPVLTRKKPERYDLAWKDLCGILNALSKIVIELSKSIVISFMFMDICNPSENSCFSKIFPHDLLKYEFLLISTYHRTFL